jgi:hypothetical protein
MFVFPRVWACLRLLPSRSLTGLQRRRLPPQVSPDCEVELNVSQFVEKEVTLGAEQLMYDPSPDFPYGQVRGVDVAHATVIAGAQKKSPPGTLQLTVWPHRGVTTLLSLWEWFWMLALPPCIVAFGVGSVGLHGSSMHGHEDGGPSETAQLDGPLSLALTCPPLPCPPCLCFTVSQKFVILDGQHRFYASQLVRKEYEQTGTSQMVSPPCKRYMPFSYPSLDPKL